MKTWLYTALRILLIFSIFPVSFSAWASVTLRDAEWLVELTPETLAINITAKDHQSIQASTGGSSHQVEKLISDDKQAQWLWDQGAYQVNAELKGSDLVVSISSQKAGELMVISQPAEAAGKGMVLPLAEGHYIPADNALWHKFLLSEMATLNTTQDLSLPLWGIDYGDISLHWLLLNPFNNQLTFKADSNRLAMALSHRFTTLDPATPMVFILHLADSHPLAGAKRYRQWLIEQGRFEQLSDKLAMLTDGDKLLGATQVYLWGNDLLAIKDISNWPGFISVLRGNSPLAKQIVAHFDSEARKVLSVASANPDGYQKKVLINALNSGLKTLARQRWQTAEPDMHILVAGYSNLRQQVAEQFAGVLKPDSSRWGSGLSIGTIEQLKSAGLSRLWIGLGDGWEGGLWLPEAVAAGVEAGYLVAPYDSYQTALPLGVNPDWATAHLGQSVYQQCAIMLADGTLKAGFNKSGHYTDPRCVRPVLQQRITAIAQQAGFNSWFLDAYATGMVFDSYRPGHTLTQAQNAQANVDSARWVSGSLNMPLGSEDGNAVTAQGIVFAHGMQTPVIGWGDPALSDPKSPYYLGRWYPNDQPSIFFKSSLLDEPYRTIYFDPVYRLPLYQAVFHDSVVTSQHWLFDNLKLSNVSVDNQLAQLLYNVAPMFHLSASTLEARLPAMLKQDAFFRPLHQRLATQEMLTFNWLSEDRLIQETRFADGSRLLANFDSKSRQIEGYKLPPQSITALLNGERQPRIYQAVGNK